jgi:hypothetical protein
MNDNKHYIPIGRKINMNGFRFLALVMIVLSTVAGAFALTPDYSTGTQPFVTIDKIEVNGVELDKTSPVYTEREEELVVDVFFTGNPFGKCTSNDSNACYDARISAEISGYEYSEVRDSEGQFEVEPGVQYKKTLRLKLPNDMPSSDNLQLEVELKDDDDVVGIRFPIRVQEIRHKLNIYDVVFNPLNNVQAGQPLFTTVRLENLGDNTESSIKVSVSAPALGLQTSEFVDKLLTLESENNNVDEDADDAATTNDLMLLIPSNTPEGDYNVVVSVEYNRGRSIEQQAYKLHVRGIQTTQTPQTSVLVSVDSSSQKVEAGKGAVYKLNIANLEMRAQTFTVDVTGVTDWGTVRVEPQNVIVQADGTTDAYVYVSPKEGTTGVKTFTVKVMSGNTAVAEKNLSLEVAPNNGVDAKTMLTWTFVALLAILVLLVIVVLVKKLAKKDSDGVEGQTYY